MPHRRLGKLLLLQPLQLLERHAALRKLVGFPLAALLHLLVLLGGLDNGTNVLGETQLVEGARDVVAGNGFLGLLF